MASTQISTDPAAAGRLPDGWLFQGFDSIIRTRLIFGNGTASRVDECARTLSARRVLLVTDKGIQKAGHADSVRSRLIQSGCDVAVFDRVLENPDTLCVADCLEVAREFRPDLLVGLGGGSSMDTAKGCNFLLTNGGRMQDYWGVGKASKPMLPLIAIPTTAGTGSECQSAALIADAETHMKMACLDPKAAAWAAILDPELTLSQPKRVTACTGIDAIAHAMETAVTTRRTAMSSMYSEKAFQLLAGSYERALANGSDLEARGRMLLGAAFAGMAIEQSMLGSAHSAANPLTARFGLVHGVAVGVMLPHVVRFNARSPAVRDAYAHLARVGGVWDGVGGAGVAVDALSRSLWRYLKVAGLPQTLGEAGIDLAQISLLAGEAERQWTAGFNPVAMTSVDFEKLYSDAMLGFDAD